MNRPVCDKCGWAISDYHAIDYIGIRFMVAMQNRQFEFHVCPNCLDKTTARELVEWFIREEKKITSLIHS